MGVILTPGYAFTRDGARKAISRERTNSLSTRRAARDFNPTVLQDVSFWVAVLSGEAEGLFALEHEPSNDLARFAPTILLSHRIPTVSFNVSAFEETSELEGEIDDDLRRLDAELEGWRSTRRKRIRTIRKRRTGRERRTGGRRAATGHRR